MDPLAYAYYLKRGCMNMFTDLPEHIQYKVKEFLELGAFKDAKDLHDDWMRTHPDPQNFKTYHSPPHDSMV